MMTKENIEELSENLVNFVGGELRILRNYLPYKPSKKIAIEDIDFAFHRSYGAFMFFLSVADDSNLFTDKELEEMEACWDVFCEEFRDMRLGV